jgi:hypothetical protein
MSSLAPITKKVVKKVIPKTTVGKVAAAAAAAVGINTIRNDSKPADKKTTAIRPADQIEAAKSGITVGQTGDGLTLSGLPKGFQISGAGAAQYEKGAGASALANLEPTQRAALLANMGRIPGLYSAGMAPTPDFINKMLSDGRVAPRLADLKALDSMAAIADWSGDTIANTVIKFANNPSLSQQYFGQITAKPKAVSSPAALEAELNDKFLDIFETKADPAAAKAYAKEINALESKGSVGTQQKEDILLKYIQKKATDQFNVGQTGMVPGVADKGALGRRVRTLRSAYDNNGIPIDERQIYNKAIATLRSEEAYQNEIDSVTMQASSVMPAFKDFFAQGKNAREVLSPWINTRAQIFGIPADQIKVSDMYEIGSGTAPLSIQDYKKQLYRSPEFKKTDAYKERSLGDLQTLLRAFNIG